MATSSSNQPLSLRGNPLNKEALTVPIHVVTNASQLPPDFLNPSLERQLVVGFDCEGVDLSRTGRLCIMQLAFEDGVYLVDAIEGGVALMNACKVALESVHVKKVIHDCKRDSEALYFQFGIKLHNVFDSQVAFALLEEQEGRDRASGNISLVALLADPRYCGIAFPEKDEVRDHLKKDPSFWSRRPLSEFMIRVAAADVRFLLYIYQKMIMKLNERLSWRLAVRGALRCRCFCFNDNEYAGWPSLPPIPDSLKAGVNPLEEEILSILDVPLGKMGRVIGKKGSSINAIRRSCNAEIHCEGLQNKVFVMGPLKEVRKAETMLKAKMVDTYWSDSDFYF